MLELLVEARQEQTWIVPPAFLAPLPSVRLVLVGQAPGPTSDPEVPLCPVTSTTGRRLRDLMQLSSEEYLLLERVNLLQCFPGKHARDDAFPRKLARVAAQAMRPLLRGRRVVLLGRKVAAAFGVELPFLMWSTWKDLEISILPHPSGRSRWYNSPENQGKAGEFLLQALTSDSPCLSSAHEADSAQGSVEG
jgi:uracil-DNA glycosylase